MSLGRVVNLGGSALLVAYGVLMAQAPPPDQPGPVVAQSPGPNVPLAVPNPAAGVQGSAGAIVALTGLIMAMAPIVVDLLKSRWAREDDKKKLADALARNVEMERRVHDLEGVTSEVPANKARLSAIAGVTEGMMEELHKTGVIQQINRPVTQRRPSMTILVVEDDPETAKVLSKLFLKLGFSPTHAATLDEARRVIGLYPHWVVLDLIVGDEDGADLLRTIREENMPVKVMILTGVADPARIRAVRALRPDAFFTKPADLIEMATVLVPGGLPEELTRPDSGFFTTVPAVVPPVPPASG